MKKTVLYTIVVLVVLVVLIIGWYIFSPVGLMVCGPCGCFNDQCGVPRSNNYWKCTDIKYYTCPAVPANYTTNSTCLNGVIQCMSCAPANYYIKNYTVTENAVGYQNISGNVTLAGIFVINNETVQLRAGQTWVLTDSTIFGVTDLTANASKFYLKSAHETKYSSLFAPYPKTTTVSVKYLLLPGACGATSFSCSSWYVPSCSADQKTLTCTKTTYQCSATKPAGSCTLVGKC